MKEDEKRWKKRIVYRKINRIKVSIKIKVFHKGGNKKSTLFTKVFHRVWKTKKVR
jgi:hypothetical protein